LVCRGLVAASLLAVSATEAQEVVDYCAARNIEGLSDRWRSIAAKPPIDGSSKEYGAMKPLAVMILSLSAFAVAFVHADRSDAASTEAPQAIDIIRNGSQPSAIGPAEHFTGSARIDSLFQARDPARVSGGIVTFEPGARTAWHTHPLGQTLIVTSGVGLVQQWGGPIQEIRPGDMVWIPPGVKHWHGATATTGMTHIAIAEALDGKSVDWMEKVTDEQYRR
jgi:quercetin dioxygenase-like cupin family protein